MFTGVVKWFNDKKGFGFISQDDGGPDIFVHYSAITMSDGTTYKSLKEGDVVEFELAPKGQRGPSASYAKKVG